MSVLAGFLMPHPPIIVPSVGRGEERPAQQTIDRCRAVASEIVDLDPETIVISSPHAPLYRDGFYLAQGAHLHGSMARFGVPKDTIDANIDTEFAQALAENAEHKGIPTGGDPSEASAFDHGTFVPLHWVREAYVAAGKCASGDPLPVQVVSLGLSGLPLDVHREFGRIVQATVEQLGRRVVYIASGDLSHRLEGSSYGFDPAGPEYENRLVGDLRSMDFDDLCDFDENLCNHAGDCGLRSVIMMSGAIEGRIAEHEVLGEESPFGIGYCVARFVCSGAKAPKNTGNANAKDSEDTRDAKNAEDATETEASGDPDPCVAIARAAVEAYVRDRRTIAVPPNTPRDLLEHRAGTFVTLYEDGELRGCIGTIGPTRDNIALEIIGNAQASCSRDPRFRPVTSDELDYLTYSVDVLSESEDINSLDQLDPNRYGVIVSKGLRRGLLLPRLDGVDTVAQQIAIARRKAGIGDTEKGVKLQRFEVVRHTRGGEARKRR